MKKKVRADSQVTELQGRGHLIGEMLVAGLEVAVPVRDRGVDLVAYLDLKASTPAFRARPVQMKSASGRHFSIAKKYARIREPCLGLRAALERRAASGYLRDVLSGRYSHCDKDGIHGDRLVERRRWLQHTESEQALGKVAGASSHE
jgi:hypothetical protein